MAEDVVRNFGFLCLGSRFRRIGERLQADTQAIIEEFGVTIQAGQYPFLGAIDRAGPLTIGELAESVGITQPGATRTLGQLTDAGLVEVRASEEDQRRKLVSLTDKGRALVERSRREIWPVIEAAVRDLCGELSGPLLEQLATIEDGLAESPLARRIKHQEKI
ncbi:MarR family transcriptional regulator [Rhizobium sp. BK376]|uniref:MarR family winged helix-turn-helix transcriptional regulator n=1 Tax=Rhizobium sp. BK376 TaxID=2512149 RepID=UPI001053598E|nr:MarR family transcriptional regulator [Rhizobium sp. BK376]TCR92105.1 DNA-binding MarR family transcriptional regulator [Rhizobium sp. BK376]